MKVSDIPKNLRDLLFVSDLITRKVAPRFDMSYWGNARGEDRAICGTSHCAAGWAAIHGVAGLGLSWRPSSKRAMLTLHGADSFGIRDSFGVAAKAFNISHTQSERIFGSTENGQNFVRDRIRKLVHELYPGAVDAWLASSAMG